MNQVVADAGPFSTCLRGSDMVGHARGARRENRHVRAAFLLDLELRPFQASTNFIVGNANVRCGRPPRRVRERRQLTIPERMELVRFGRIVAVAVDDHLLPRLQGGPNISWNINRLRGRGLRGCHATGSETASGSDFDAGVTRMVAAMTAASSRKPEIVARASEKLPVDSLTRPISQGPIKPPNWAMVFTVAIEAAAAIPVMNEAFRLQNNELPELSPSP